MTAYTEKYLAAFHRRSLKNQEAIQGAKQVGCFQCCKIFPASEVTEFTENGQSADAWCPKCGIDSIIVDDGVNEFTPELIQALYERYFYEPTEEEFKNAKVFYSFEELIADKSPEGNGWPIKVLHIPLDE